MSILEQLVDFFSPESDEKSSDYDLEYIRELEHRDIETVVLDGCDEQLRCEFCGRLFALREIEDVLDHTTNHHNQFGDGETPPHRLLTAPPGHRQYTVPPGDGGDN